MAAAVTVSQSLVSVFTACILLEKPLLPGKTWALTGGDFFQQGLVSLAEFHKSVMTAALVRMMFPGQFPETPGQRAFVHEGDFRCSEIENLPGPGPGNGRFGTLGLVKKSAAKPEIPFHLFQENRIPVRVIKKHGRIPDQMFMQVSGMVEKGFV